MRQDFEEWTNGLKVCINCCVNIHDMVFESISKIDKNIRDKYRITEVGSKPVKFCHCPNISDMIAFDYFTPETEQGDKYYLVLTGLCRSCEGYKVLELRDTEFDFVIKEPPSHLGLHINGKRLNLDHYT